MACQKSSTRKPVRKNKFGNIKCRAGDKVFPSKLERDCFVYLRSKKDVLKFETQVTYFLVEKSDSHKRGIRYIADFVVELSNGVELVIDSKSLVTANLSTFKLKKALFESKFNKKLHVVYSTKQLANLIFKSSKTRNTL